MTSITAIWRFPVKSVGGEQLESAAVGPLGVEGDRAFGILDVETGNVLTARRSPELLMATARLVDGTPVITTDAGEQLDGDAALSAWLGRPVELRAAGESDTGGTYENPMNAEEETEWVSWTGPAGAWHDSRVSRVSLVSAASLGDWDIRRFRTNVAVDGAGEDAWVGQRLRIGADGVGPVLSVAKQIDRCVMVSRPQPGLDKDLDVLRTINRERASCLSVGALVEREGRIAVGDAIDVIGPAA